MPREYSDAKREMAVLNEESMSKLPDIPRQVAESSSQLVDSLLDAVGWDTQNQAHRRVMEKLERLRRGDHLQD